MWARGKTSALFGNGGNDVLDVSTAIPGATDNNTAVGKGMRAMD